MVDQKILSILIPSYNYRFGVLRILKDLEKLSIHFKSKFEIIIFDDSIKSILEPNDIRYFHNKSLNLVYKKNKIRKGACNNWNSLLENSNGRYKWLLAHDEFPLDIKSQFEAIFKVIEICKPKVIILPVVVKKHLVKEIFLKVKVNPPYRILLIFLRNPELLFIANLFGSPSSFIVSQDSYYKFDERFKRLIDIEAYYKLLKHTKINEIKVLNSKECLLGSEIIKGSITDKIGSQKEFLAREETKLFFSENKLKEKSSIFKFVISKLYFFYKILTLKIFI